MLCTLIIPLLVISRCGHQSHMVVCCMITFSKFDQLTDKNQAHVSSVICGVHLHWLCTCTFSRGEFASLAY